MFRWHYAQININLLWILKIIGTIIKQLFEEDSTQVMTQARGKKKQVNSYNAKNKRQLDLITTSHLSKLQYVLRIGST